MKWEGRIKNILIRLEETKGENEVDRVCAAFCRKVESLILKPDKPRQEENIDAVKDRHLDDLWSKVVKMRDSWTCQCCGHGKHDGYNVEAAHVFGRTAKLTRWVPENGICLCAFCHGYFTQNSCEWSMFVLGYSLEVVLNITGHPDKKISVGFGYRMGELKYTSLEEMAKRVGKYRNRFVDKKFALYLLENKLNDLEKYGYAGVVK